MTIILLLLSQVIFAHSKPLSSSHYDFPDYDYGEYEFEDFDNYPTSYEDSGDSQVCKLLFMY